MFCDLIQRCLVSGLWMSLFTGVTHFSAVLFVRTIKHVFKCSSRHTVLCRPQLWANDHGIHTHQAQVFTLHQFHKNPDINVFQQTKQHLRETRKFLWKDRSQRLYEHQPMTVPQLLTWDKKHVEVHAILQKNWVYPQQRFPSTSWR
jgi:hypothetical protein